VSAPLKFPDIVSTIQRAILGDSGASALRLDSEIQKRYLASVRETLGSELGRVVKLPDGKQWTVATLANYIRVYQGTFEEKAQPKVA